MAYVPQDAKWYLAEVVEAISVGRRATKVVHINMLLVRASSPEDAHARALELGRQSESRYENREGEVVRCRFLGLRDLWVIHEELEHGAELGFQERRVRSMREARKMVSPKRELGVFAPRQVSSGPDYLSTDIARQLDEAMGSAARPAPHEPPATRRPPRRRLAR